jgi:hypothetical protein
VTKPNHLQALFSTICDVTDGDYPRHQKQALTFLQQREAGWNFDPRSLDFWDFRQTSQAAL